MNAIEILLWAAIALWLMTGGLLIGVAVAAVILIAKAITGGGGD